MNDENKASVVDFLERFIDSRGCDEEIICPAIVLMESIMHSSSGNNPHIGSHCFFAGSFANLIKLFIVSNSIIPQ